MAIGNIIYSTSSSTIVSGDAINASDFERSTNLQVDTTTGNLNIAGSVNATGGIVASGTSSLGSVGSVKISGGSSGQVLTTDGSSNLSWATVSIPSRVEAFTSSTTWTAPAGVTRVYVRAVGGGGAGGRYTTNVNVLGGGGGGYAESVVTVTPGLVYLITVGSGGTGTANANSPGGDGGFSSFSYQGTFFIVAYGGTGGGTNTAVSGGGGSFEGASNIYGIQGVRGRTGAYDEKSGYTGGGAGGIAAFSRPGYEIFSIQQPGQYTVGFFGDGGRGSTSTISAMSGTRYGAGGGSTLRAESSGNGSQGLVIIQY